MGMYTELFLQVGLKEDTPDEVINTLAYMLGETEREPEEAPFESDRWEFMLRCSSHYHYPFSHSHLDKAAYLNQFFLFVRCDFKNYSNKLGKFLNWIAPWVDSESSRYQGHHMYEECEKPTQIKFNSGKVDF